MSKPDKFIKNVDKLSTKIKDSESYFTPVWSASGLTNEKLSAEIKQIS